MRSIIAALAISSVQAIYYGDYESLIQQEPSLLSLSQTGTINGFSPIDIEVDGVKNTYYVAADFSSSDSSSYYCPSNGRGYVSTTPSLDYQTDQYFKANLLGGSIEWDVDLSDHECGCIAAFYTVSMPGKDQNGDYWWSTDGWGYCDANQVDGNWCPEFDLMEANKWSWATTAHKCDDPTAEGKYWYCDQGGLGLNIVDQFDWDTYGPGSQYKINTDLEFHAKVQFNKDDNGHFSSF